MDESRKPHWAWPHIPVGVALAIVAYFFIYRFTGDSDLLYPLMIGAGGMAATWAYFRFFFVQRNRLP